jgi:hypothetical protein
LAPTQSLSGPANSCVAGTFREGVSHFVPARETPFWA